MYGHRRVVESLIVGVAEYEAHIMDALFIHVIDCITAATAYTNYLDDAVLFLWFSKIQNMWSVILHDEYLY